MLVAIRIRGPVGMKATIEETMTRLRMRRKFACTVVRNKPENLGMIKKVSDFVAYGKIDKETFIELIKKRGQSTDKKKKIDAEKIATEMFESKTDKKLSDFGVKEFFRLHPPRGGIETKKRFPKGDIGNHNEKINELVRRML